MMNVERSSFICCAICQKALASFPAKRYKRAPIVLVPPHGPGGEKGMR
jgi:hypothetical protein